MAHRLPPLSRPLDTVLYTFAALALGSCGPSAGDDDAAIDDDATADDDATPDDDTTGDGTLDDDSGQPDDPCEGVSWVTLSAPDPADGEVDPHDFDTVQPGMDVSAAEAVGRVRGTWSGAVSYSSGTGDTTGAAALRYPNEGFRYRAPVDACPAALAIPFETAVATPGCTFAATAEVEMMVLAADQYAYGWAEDFAVTASTWIPDFDPAEWDSVELRYDFWWVFPEDGELVDDALDVSVSAGGSRETGGGSGEGFVEPVATLVGWRDSLDMGEEFGAGCL